MPKERTHHSRACDGCYRRKIKCSGHPKCKQCTDSKLICTTNRLFGRRGPKARSLTRNSQGCFVFIKGGALPIDLSAFEEAGDAITGMQIALETGWNESPSLQSMVDFETIRNAATYCADDMVSQCLIIAITLFLLAQDENTLMTPMIHCSPNCDHQWQTHLKRCTENLREHRTDLNLTLQREQEWIVILLIISQLYHKLAESMVSWYYLQEAITVSLIGSQAMSSTQCLSGQSLYLAVMERCRAINEHKSVGMNGHSLPKHGFEDMLAIYELFKPFDNSFMMIWNNTCASPPFQYLMKLQQHVVVAAGSTELTHFTKYCGIVARYWLLSVIWRLVVRIEALENVPASLSILCWDPEATVSSLLRDTESIPREVMLHYTELTVRSGTDRNWKILKCTQVPMISDIYWQYLEVLDQSDLLEHQHHNLEALDHIIALLSGRTAGRTNVFTTFEDVSISFSDF